MATPTAEPSPPERRCSDVPECARAVPTRRGAAHFLRIETVGRVRYGGASGQLTVRAFVQRLLAPPSRRTSAARWVSASPRQHKGLRELIAGDPTEQDWTDFPTGWTAPPMWPRPPIPTPSADMNRTPRRCECSSSAGEAHARFLSWPSSPPTAIRPSPTGTVGVQDGTGGRSSPPRRDRERHSRPETRGRTQPSPLEGASRHGG